MTEEALDFWWWGEDEAPGLSLWLEDACAAFAGAGGPPVRLRLLRHDQVLRGFREAMEAGRGPDLHFFWNGIYLVDHVWRGHVLPLDDLLDPDELAAIGGGPQSRVDGRTYRAGWYVIPVVWVVNQAVLESAGVPEVPATYAQFLDACERVTRAGLRAVTVGDGEGDFSVWWLTHFLTQELDEPADAVRLVLGDLDWRDARYARPWRLLGELRSLGYLDLEALPLTLWKGFDRFNQGKSAFTLASGPMFAACRRALGTGAAVGAAPRSGEGRLAARMIVDTQGIGISAASRQPEASAWLLRVLHDDVRRQALWDEVSLFPTDTRWGGPPLDADGAYREMWSWYARGAAAPYVPNLWPLELHYDLAAAIGREVLDGTLSSDRAGDAAAERSLRWREENVAGFDRYRGWALEAGEATKPPQTTPRLARDAR